MNRTEKETLLKLADEWDLPAQYTGPTADAWRLAASQLRTMVASFAEAEV